MFEKKSKRFRILFLLGALLTILIVLTPYPRQFVKHLAQMFVRGKEKLGQINWVQMPNGSPVSTETVQSSRKVVAFSPPISKTRLPQAKWSWPSFGKSEPAPTPSAYPSRNPWPIPKRFTLSHIEGNNFTNCFATNYTKAQLLFAGEYVPGKFLPQIDFRGDRFDDTTYAASGGVVLRYVPKKNGPVKRILGANIYYDYRQGNVGYFNQIGGGIEVLSKRWDFRANVYVPVGGKRKLRHCVFDDFDGDFFAIKDTFESVSFAYNLEVGYLAVNSQYLLLYIAGGPYYIAGRKCFDKTRGGEIRIQPQYKDYIALNAIYSYDPLFNSF